MKSLQWAKIWAYGLAFSMGLSPAEFIGGYPTPRGADGIGCGVGCGVVRGGTTPFTFADLGDAWWIDPVGDPLSVTYAPPPSLPNTSLETTTGWAPVNDAVLTTVTGLVGNGMRVAYNGTANPYTIPVAFLTVGNRYSDVGVYGRGDGSSDARMYHDGSIFAQTSLTDWTLLDMGEFTATVNIARLWTVGTTYSEYDEVNPGTNHSVVGIEARGPGLNRCNDGRMEYVGVASWAAVDATLTKESGSPSGDGTQVLRVTCTAATFYATQSGILTLGHTYRLRGWARSSTASQAPRVLCGLNAGWDGEANTDWQYFDVVVLCGGNTTLYVGSIGTIVGSWVEFDQIEVIDLDDPCGSIVQASATAMSWIDPNTGWVRYDTSSTDRNASNLPNGAFDFLHDGRPFSIAGVFSVTSDSSAIFGNFNTFTQFGILVLVSPSTGVITIYIANGTGAPAWSTSLPTGAIIANKPFQLVMVHEGLGGSFKIWIDGVLVHNTASTSGFIAGLPSYPMNFGYGGVGYAMTGSHADVMFRPTALTDAERANVERMLSNKHNIPLSYDELSDAELEGWAGLVTWVDPLYEGAYTYAPQLNSTDFNMDGVDTSAYLSGAGATLSKESASPYEGIRNMRVTDNGGGAIDVYKLGTSGNRYYLRIAMRASSGVTVGAGGGSGTEVGWPYTSTNWGLVEGDFTLPSPGFRFGVMTITAGVGSWFEIDAASVVNESLVAVTPRAGATANNLTQASAGYMPWEDIATGGISFAVDDGIVDSAAGATTAVKCLNDGNGGTLVMTWKQGADVSGTKYLWDTGEAGSNSNGFQIYRNASNYVAILKNGTAKIGELPLGTISASTRVVVMRVTSTQLLGRLDGVSSSVLLTGTPLDAAATFGARIGANPPYAITNEMVTYDCLVFSRILSLTEAIRLETKLAAKYA